MQADKLIAGIERFFYDIVGSVIPGSVLLVGLWLLLQPSNVVAPTSAPGWWLFIGGAFLVGNALATLGELVVVPLSRRIGHLFNRRLPATEEAAEEGLAARATARLAAARWLPGVQVTGREVRQLRNVAMSVIPADDRATVTRFMFLSLMSLGAGTALTLLVAVAFSLHWTSWNWGARVGYAGIGLATIAVLLIRRFQFYYRSQRLPFDMAAARIDGPAAKETNSELRQEGELRSVYLAGGHGSRWRDTVRAALPQLDVRDPSEHEIQDSRAYTAWDLEAVRRSDVLFAYYEKSNPSGFGLAVEVGFAAALRKHVIFVDEKSTFDPSVARYLRIVHETSSTSFGSLDEGIAYLKKLVEQLGVRSGAGAIRNSCESRSTNST